MVNFMLRKKVLKPSYKEQFGFFRVDYGEPQPRDVIMNSGEDDDDGEGEDDLS